MNDQVAQLAAVPALRQETPAALYETASSAVAAQKRAAVESRYVMALRQPRNWDQVRQDLLKECQRPAFARNKSALYRKPIGAGVEGLGIRFVEVALRCMKNVLVETEMIFEDQLKEIHRVTVTDLENNLTYPLDVRVSKTVERSKPADDGSYISVRMNSYNKPTYTVPGTDDDLLNKRAALISKAIRTLGLRVIPGDMQDEAEEIIRKIRADDAAADPDAERKRIADAFAELAVKVVQLNEYLGHDFGTCSPAELVELRGMYGAIKDGEATWKGFMDAKVGASDGDSAERARGALDKINAKIKTGSNVASIPTTAGGDASVKSEAAANSAAADTEKKSDAPVEVTYALVAAKISGASNTDQLNEAVDLIKHVADKDQQKELRELAKARAKELAGAKT